MSSGLDLVRRMAKVHEQVSRREVADAVTELTGAETVLGHLLRERDGLRHRLQVEATSGAAAGALADGYRYLGALEMRIGEARETVEALGQTLLERETAWMGKRKELRGLDTVHARRLRAESARRERRVQKALDDLKRPESPVLALEIG